MPDEGDKNFSSNEKEPYDLNRIRETNPRAYRRWEPSEEEELKRLFEQGISIEEIATKLERQNGGITSRLVVLGLIKE